MQNMSGKMPAGPLPPIGVDLTFKLIGSDELHVGFSAHRMSASPLDEGEMLFVDLCEQRQDRYAYPAALVDCWDCVHDNDRRACNFKKETNNG